MNERLRNLENNVADLRDLKSAYAISDIKNDKKKEETENESQRQVVDNTNNLRDVINSEK